MSGFTDRARSQRETSPDIIDDLRSNLDENEGALAMVAPYSPEQISPTRAEWAEIGFTEELKVETAIEELNRHDISNLHLLINSLGGGVSSSFKIARALCMNFDNITVYVPHMAISGGTLVALAGNNIVLGEMSSISPIDPQTTRNGKQVSANSLIRMFTQLNSYFSDMHPKDAPYPWKALADKLDPVEVQEYIDASNMMEKHARQILDQHIDDDEELERIIRKLTNEYPTHSYAITFPEAENILKDIIVHADDSPLNEIMKQWLHQYIDEEARDHHVKYFAGSTEEKDTNNEEDGPEEI